MHSLIPTSDEYARLMHKKFEIERLIERGGWGPQVPASALKPGDPGPAVVALRNRLIAMGYLEPLGDDDLRRRHPDARCSCSRKTWG